MLRLHSIVPALCLVHKVMAFNFPPPTIKVTNGVFLGNQTSNVTGTFRDGGAEGVIGGTYFQLYADTDYCYSDGPGNPPSQNFGGHCQPTVANTVAFSTSNPLRVNDPYPGPLVGLFCDEGSFSHNARLHLSNILPITSTVGAAWYENLTIGTGFNGYAVGGGAVQITYTGGNTAPKCTVLPDIWGPREPQFGAGGTVVVPNADGYTYMLGGLSSNYYNGTGYTDNNSYSYAARVYPQNAHDATQYQYWNGTQYQSTRLINPDNLGTSPAAITDLKGNYGLGLSYMPYYGCFIVFYNYIFDSRVYAKTAYNIAGPWGPETVVYTNDPKYGFVYAISPQYHFDPTGRTLILDFSVSNGLYVQSANITFTK